MILGIPENSDFSFPNPEDLETLGRTCKQLLSSQKTPVKFCTQAHNCRVLAFTVCTLVTSQGH
jgi:hypothetical protein